MLDIERWLVAAELTGHLPKRRAAPLDQAAALLALGIGEPRSLVKTQAHFTRRFHSPVPD